MQSNYSLLDLSSRDCSSYVQHHNRWEVRVEEVYQDRLQGAEVGFRLLLISPEGMDYLPILSPS